MTLGVYIRILLQQLLSDHMIYIVQLLSVEVCNMFRLFEFHTWFS